MEISAGIGTVMMCGLLQQPKLMVLSFVVNVEGIITLLFALPPARNVHLLIIGRTDAPNVFHATNGVTTRLNVQSGNVQNVMIQTTKLQNVLG
jgi:hypothetical protein